MLIQHLTKHTFRTPVPTARGKPDETESQGRPRRRLRPEYGDLPPEPSQVSAVTHGDEPEGTSCRGGSR